MKVTKRLEKISDMDSSYFEDLIRLLNSNHTVELVDGDKYLFQALYSQIFFQMRERSAFTDFTGFSNQIEEVFFFELNKINIENQNRLEKIMSNNGIKTQIIEYLSKQVYEQLKANKSF